ncbi:hypothetical protein BDN70DRAFT_902210, partial [Pholiota conissans]
TLLVAFRHLIQDKEGDVVLPFSYVMSKTNVAHIHRWRVGALGSVRRKNNLLHPSLEGREAPRVAVGEAGHIPQQRGVALSKKERGKEGWWWLKHDIDDVQPSSMLSFGEFRREPIGWDHRAALFNFVVVIDNDEIAMDS